MNEDERLLSAARFMAYVFDREAGKQYKSAPWSQRFRRCLGFARKRRKHGRAKQWFVALWASRLKEMGAAVDEINGRLL